MQETPTEIRLIKPGAVLGPNDNGDDSEPYFSLEYQLRDFLASNLNTISISGKRLRLFVDPTGRDGVEFSSAVGPIDILAIDDKDSFFVFELKRANSPDRAIGQLARYMGWVRQTIGKGREVFGATGIYIYAAMDSAVVYTGSARRRQRRKRFERRP